MHHALTGLSDTTGTVSVSIAGTIIVYVILPLLVLGIAAMITWTINVSRRLDAYQSKTDSSLAEQDKALAVLITQVSPPNAKSLREVLEETRLDLARLSPTLGITSVRVERNDPHGRE